MIGQEKPNLILFFLYNWLIFLSGFVIGVIITVFIISPIITGLLTGVWEIDTFDKYYRYLIACIPAGFIAAIGSTIECWLRTRKKQLSPRRAEKFTHSAAWNLSNLTSDG